MSLYKIHKLIILQTCFFLYPAAVYMSEWERSKAQPPKAADNPEEGAAQAAETESHEGQSASEGEGSSEWPPASVGVTYELCAGLVDKPDLSLEEIARQEVLEECGYDVPACKLKRITSYRSGSFVFTLHERVKHGKHVLPGKCSANSS